MLPKSFEHRTACCFTGHRLPGLPDGGDERGADMNMLKLRLQSCVEEAIETGVRVFYAGGAAGFDTLAAEAVLLWRDRYYPAVRLMLALPDRAQSASFSARMRARYERILAQADGVYFASQDEGGTGALLRRNRYMVEHADCCIAYLKILSGGTLYTVHYALERGIPVYNLAQCDKS